ncbi:MBL fold metallo-hydrolase [Bacillus sp. FJAT-44742]|uniref:MBL fold metallo-hydrolase n=1 Tax=Bacillus sp. FJAT-44742 TaxID=2014005 RepID=UPI001E31A5A1|nr:MBL fold metallo-hydrolase [Bacillus sp. FJAT-44742]
MNKKHLLPVVSAFSLLCATGCGEEMTNQTAEETSSEEAAEQVTEEENEGNESGATEAEVEAEAEEEATEQTESDEGVNEEQEEVEQDEEGEETTEDSSFELEDLEELIVHFMDVGQADATLFEYSYDGDDYTILFDAGNWNQNNVVDYLHSQDIESVDVMILSHPHADHIGQADTILEQFTVEEVWMSGDTHTSQTFERVMDAIDESDVAYEEPRAGEVYDVGPLTIEMVNPDSINGDLHQGSLSARFLYGDSFSLLLTGDAEQETEQAMINRGHEVEADILQLGHHGSDTSTTSAFLDEVRPEIAIYSAGEGNQYGHPHDSVINRLEEREIEIYGTDVHGTIIVTTDGESYQVTTSQEGTVSLSSNEAEETSSGDSSASSSENSSEEHANDPAPPAPEEEAAEEVEEETVQEEPVKEEAAPTGCIDINSASFEELQEIHQIGPERAEQIEELRPFSSVDDMTRISGVGPARIDEIKAEGLACVGG